MQALCQMIGIWWTLRSTVRLTRPLWNSSLFPKPPKSFCSNTKSTEFCYNSPFILYLLCHSNSTAGIIHCPTPRIRTHTNSYVFEKLFSLDCLDFQLTFWALHLCQGSPCYAHWVLGHYRQCYIGVKCDADLLPDGLRPREKIPKVWSSPHKSETTSCCDHDK